MEVTRKGKKSWVPMPSISDITRDWPDMIAVREAADRVVSEYLRLLRASHGRRELRVDEVDRNDRSRATTSFAEMITDLANREDVKLRMIPRAGLDKRVPTMSKADFGTEIWPHLVKKVRTLVAFYAQLVLEYRDREGKILSLPDPALHFAIGQGTLYYEWSVSDYLKLVFVYMSSDESQAYTAIYGFPMLVRLDKNFPGHLDLSARNWHVQLSMNLDTFETEHRLDWLLGAYGRERRTTSLTTPVTGKKHGHSSRREWAKFDVIESVIGGELIRDDAVVSSVVHKPRFRKTENRIGGQLIRDDAPVSSFVHKRQFRKTEDSIFHLL